MKVFISWSGPISGELAKLIYQWLPMVLQHVRPFLSLEEVEKGARWYTTVANELEQSNFGIVCLTPENLNSRWLHFEAGAIARSVDQSRVAPILFGLAPSDVQGPLAQFQLTRFEKEEVRRLIFAINSGSAEVSLAEPNLERVYDALWPNLDACVSELRDNRGREADNHVRDPQLTQSILEELLEIARFQMRYLSSDELVDHIAARVTRGAERDLMAQASSADSPDEAGNSILNYIRRHILLSDVIKRYVKLDRRRREWLGLSAHFIARRHRLSM